MISFIVVLVIFAVVVSILLQLPMLQEFRQPIVLVALLLMLLYVLQHFGLISGHGL